MADSSVLDNPRGKGAKDWVTAVEAEIARLEALARAVPIIELVAP